MATGNKPFPQMHPVSGFKLGTTSAGIKTPGRSDLVVMELQPWLHSGRRLYPKCLSVPHLWWLPSSTSVTQHRAIW